ncbi:hypothetical protein [Alteromonas macleodii]|uniref:Uncharacterized protein n=1 Tax=Alteromonas macleodii TaxID=28108 RepID=A0AB36FRJ4_ALTMA|nr:hypothetical protein [Alteromonas macleodii]OES24138.1 hypothetical protein BFV93_4738 [Alteromonas macleodii]OES24772.1 hypothetical protein BFV95_4531 [Alteromonas macleodii]OES25050.1 hypothetical protein BFV94_4521 [Alteromonas macleodii]OES39093.1 hypothetical protein BFV96_4241 [Alteromonas macleodii]
MIAMTSDDYINHPISLSTVKYMKRAHEAGGSIGILMTVVCCVLTGYAACQQVSVSIGVPIGIISGAFWVFPCLFLAGLAFERFYGVQDVSVDVNGETQRVYNEDLSPASQTLQQPSGKASLLANSIANTGRTPLRFEVAIMRCLNKAENGSDDMVDIEPNGHRKITPWYTYGVIGFSLIVIASMAIYFLPKFAHAMAAYAEIQTIETMATKVPHSERVYVDKGSISTFETKSAAAVGININEYSFEARRISDIGVLGDYANAEKVYVVYPAQESLLLNGVLLGALCFERVESTGCFALFSGKTFKPAQPARTE